MRRYTCRENRKTELTRVIQLGDAFQLICLPGIRYRSGNCVSAAIRRTTRTRTVASSFPLSPVVIGGVTEFAAMS